MMSNVQMRAEAEQLQAGTHLPAWNCKAGFFQHRSIEDLHVKEVHLTVCGHNLPSRVHNHMAVLQALGICAAILLKAA